MPRRNEWGGTPREEYDEMRDVARKRHAMLRAKAAKKGKKKCSRCHQVKPVKAFRIHGGYKGGRETICALCRDSS